ncbi:hypothetical protein CBR_g12774 [Chara braunii]|uniref:mRNA cap guanine-N(7) methyltransferase n=1 Tax=Chara braunii TaxID=69332 RepID=A0A388KSN2_CHABU|nr:hypothetical protein CBR_g12774 [Chara braunii]|eukprot:GBG73057.1 hypothetical protein CBR_g12774 [Chara braunii]
MLPSRKRSRSYDDVDGRDDDRGASEREFGDMPFVEEAEPGAFEPPQKLVALHYNLRENQTKAARENSPIIHLKKLNNWVKSTLIRRYTSRGDAVLDLACGKGGDLLKWDKAQVSYYVGVDIAIGSLKDFQVRYNGPSDHSRHWQPTKFPAKLICADCFEVSLEEPLKDDAPFDVCSCQFALHYSFQTCERVETALRNVASMLRPGGVFIGTMTDANVIVRKLREATTTLEFHNSVYGVRFGEAWADKKFAMDEPFGIEYQFHLEDAVDCPEYLVPMQVLQWKADQYDLDLEVKENFHEYIHKHCQEPENAELMRKMGVLGNDKQGTVISEDEWDAAYLYLVFVFRKRGGRPRPQDQPRRDRGGFRIINVEDIVTLS